ncbi:MAG TPA: PfkB family carbohydrate kinase [Gemmatimonadaceae bacterium]|nr:PfkB family carbohydrate kinase [Gemmatimonadaceae bacterium]
MSRLTAAHVDARNGAPARKKRIGVIGSLVWDVIHGRDARTVPVEEWGGITYSLSGLDAALPDDWEIVPIMMVGQDLAARAREFLRTLRHIAPDASLLEVPYPAQRVTLRYQTEERRTEHLTGGMPAWSWLALKPLLDDARLDALLINFLSGWELDLETTQLIRQHFTGPIHCDLHMMAWAVQPDGLRTLRPIPNVAEWCRCFDFLQMNEDELAMVAPDPMSLAATAIAAGVSCLFVTLGKRGAIYVAAPGFATICDLPPRTGLSTAPRGGTGAMGAVRTALVPAEPVDVPGDPTGCGDVWGATYFSRMVAGDKLADAMSAAGRAAARNVGHRGVTGLAAHLRGELSLT